MRANEAEKIPKSFITVKLRPFILRQRIQSLSLNFAEGAKFVSKCVRQTTDTFFIDYLSHGQ